MKLYIDNFNIDILDEYNKNLQSYELNKTTEYYIELFTDAGIYKINNNSIYLLEAIDREIIKYAKYFNNITLICDSSYFIENKTNYIDGSNHFSRQIKREIYKHNSNTKIKLIIESYLSDNEYLRDNNEFKPNNIYFECDNEKNINDLFIKQEIIEFLSVLN
jgi:hypothetical protein